jgi:LDH2 family malate/lactate/ureidoglycolate dehydrogenase
VYVRRAALDDCVALCSAVTRPAIAPWGGIEPMVGTNPIALAAPIEGRGPFVLDMATSVTAMGKITRAKDLGQSIPPGWAMDRHGDVTTDPAAATLGSLLPIGEHKGYGLAMAMEILASMLSGGALAGEVESWIAQTRKPTDACFTVVAMNLSAFGDPAAFRRRMREWVDHLATATPRPGFERIYYPGEIEDLACERRRREGIPLQPVDLAMLARLARRFGVPCTFA